MMMVGKRSQQQQQQHQDERCNNGQRRLRRKRTMTNSHFLLLTTVIFLECSAVAGSSSSSSSWPPPSTPPPPPPPPPPSSSSSLPEDNPLLSRLEASIFAESALVDKESGRIYWEGGCRSTLSASLVPHLQRFGFSIHLRAMVLTCFLLLAVMGALSSWLRLKLAECEMFHTLVSSSTNSYCSYIVLFLINRLLLGTPKLNKWFIVTIIILYLVESYTCETHDYLRNAIQSPHGVEDYIERIRQEPPDVHWKVQSFHYVPTSPLEAIHQAIFRTRRRSQHFGGKNDDDSQVEIVDDKSDNDDTTTVLLYSPNKRKRVTERATGSYHYKHWQDKTIAGIWQRAQSSAYAASSSSGSGGSGDHPAPFAKIVLTKLLVLADKKTRLDYFQQQAAFVTKHTNQQLHHHHQQSSRATIDEFADFSTHINVAGFQPRLLALRRPPQLQGYYWQNVNKIFRLHHFWLFTLLGLTLPYRIWFGRHCDELRVTVVKETSTVPISSPLSSSSSYLSRGWFGAKAQAQAAAIENFRELMERLQLYTKRDSAITSSVSQQQQQQQDSNVAEIEEALQAAALLKEKLITTQSLQPGGDGMLAASGSGSSSRKLRAGSTSQATSSNDENHDIHIMDTDADDSSSSAS